MLHLVLDHSALIPCGSKPPEEKAAIIQLADRLVYTSAVWHVTAYYLRVLRDRARRQWRRHREQGLLPEYPRLIRGLDRTLDRLILTAKHSKSVWCKPKPLPGGENMEARLTLHVIGREALQTLPQSQREALESIAGSLTREDREVLAIALKAAAAREAVLVTADNPMLEAAGRLREALNANLAAYRPSEALDLITT